MNEQLNKTVNRSVAFFFFVRPTGEAADTTRCCTAVYFQFISGMAPPLTQLCATHTHTHVASDEGQNEICKGFARPPGRGCVARQRQLTAD